MKREDCILALMQAVMQLGVTGTEAYGPSLYLELHVYPVGCSGVITGIILTLTDRLILEYDNGLDVWNGPIEKEDDATLLMLVDYIRCHF